MIWAAWIIAKWKSMEGMDHSAMGHDMSSMGEEKMTDMTSGWKDASTPKGHKALDYSDLRYLGTQGDTRPPEREILVGLGWEYGALYLDNEWQEV